MAHAIGQRFITPAASTAVERAAKRGRKEVGGGNEEFVAITKRNRGAAIAEMECVIEIRPRADVRPYTEREGRTIAV